MKALRFALPLFLLTLSAVCQTTYPASYPVTGGSGTATSPTRISFSAMNGSQFFESGYGTSCGDTMTVGMGFVLLNGGQFGYGICANVTTQPVGSCGNLYAEFYGKDAAGIPFTGSLSLTTTCQYVRLRYSKTVYTVSGGVLTISE